MMHKVYIDDKPLIFLNVYDKVDSREGFSVLSDSEFDLNAVLNKLNDERIGIIYLSANPDQAWISFTSRYTLIEAAGGLVENESGEYLIIYRKKRWDLPKGKLDYNESPAEAAVREVQEECGIDDLEIERPLLKTFHTYSEKGKNILKKTHWFFMRTSDTDLKPQKEENIEKAVWMNIDEIKNKVLSHTYSAIREVFRNFLEVKI